MYMYLYVYHMQSREGSIHTNAHMGLSSPATCSELLNILAVTVKQEPEFCDGKVVNFICYSREKQELSTVYFAKFSF